MLVDLRELRERSEPLVVEADFSERQLRVEGPAVALLKPVHARLKVSLHGEKVWVTGRIEAELGVNCSRCLRRLSQTVDKAVDLEYWPDPLVEDDKEELALTYDELDIGFYRNDELDLSGVVSEQVVLEIPMKPVCREGCRGLCPQCGADLNEANCGCDHTVSDPRFAALAELKKRLDDPGLR